MARKILTYTSDSEEETQLTVAVVGQGWIEYLQQFCHVYATRHFPLDFYEQESNRLLHSLQTLWPEIPDNFGYIHYLMNVLRDQDFLLPVFSIYENNGIRITCGNTRFASHKFSGKDPASLGLVVFSQHEINRPDFIKLTSTQQFDDLYKLNDTDIKISMDHTEDQITVTSSVLRHTIYDRNPMSHSDIIGVQRNKQKFWSRYLEAPRTQVSTKIYCRPEHRKFILPSPVFKFEFVDVDSTQWYFSFGKLLGAFKKDPENPVLTPPTFNVWLFDATEPFHLEWFMVYFRIGASCVYTQNQKVVVFDPNGHESEYKIVPNIVK